jgi:hypothetical protein
MNQSTLGDGDEVVSITDAAKRLRVSVRTVQRRLDGGQLKAVIEGDTRRVRLPIEGDSATRQGDATAGHLSRDGDTTARQVKRHHFEEGDKKRVMLSRQEATDDAPQGDGERDTAHDSATLAQSTLASLLLEKDARIIDLRAQIDAQRLQIEAANRATAEAHAALREALKMSNRALMEPGQSTLEAVSSTPAQSRPMAADEAQSTLMSKEAPQPISSPQIEAQREVAPKYFERSKGLRAWLLKVLRG